MFEDVAGGVRVGELQSALDALAAEDLFALPPGAVLGRTGMLLQLVNRANAELTRTVRHADATGACEHDGKKTAASWLRGHGHLTATEAGKLVRSGRALEHLPATAAAFADGTITASQVAAIAPIADDAARAAADQQGVDLGVIDQAVVEVAHGKAHARLSQVVHHYREALDPDGTEPDPTEGRRFSVTRHADGSGTGRFDLDAVGIEKVLAGIESIVQASRPKGDDRTRAQQQADALVQLCDNQLASGNLPTLRTQKPHVVLGLDLEDLIDPATNPGAAWTGLGAQISAARARWLACDGSISRILMTPDGEVLDLGRDHRVVTPGLRKAVELRDRHCVFAGCDAPTHWCDVHHLIHWINGGETSLENSGLLCERHHTKVHHGFRIERDPCGRWRTWRPDGTEILIGQLLQV